MLVFPTITAATLGAIIILQMLLGLRTSIGRLNLRKNSSDEALADLTVRVRSHGNLIENAPIVLLSLGLLEANGGNALAISVLAGTFFIGRLLHPVGMAMKKAPNAPRFFGAVTSYMVGIISGVWLLVTALLG